MGYGYTDDCPGCSAKKPGLSISKPHSANCRKRVEERIGEDPRGQETKDRVNEKCKQWAARELKKKTVVARRKGRKIRNPKALEPKLMRQRLVLLHGS